MYIYIEVNDLYDYVMVWKTIDFVEPRKDCTQYWRASRPIQ